MDDLTSDNCPQVSTARGTTSVPSGSLKLQRDTDGVESEVREALDTYPHAAIDGDIVTMKRCRGIIERALVSLTWERDKAKDSLYAIQVLIEVAHRRNRAIPGSRILEIIDLMDGD